MGSALVTLDARWHTRTSSGTGNTGEEDIASAESPSTSSHITKVWHFGLPDDNAIIAKTLAKAVESPPSVVACAPLEHQQDLARLGPRRAHVIDEPVHAARDQAKLTFELPDNMQAHIVRPSTARGLLPVGMARRPGMLTCIGIRFPPQANPCIDLGRAETAWSTRVHRQAPERTV